MKLQVMKSVLSILGALVFTACTNEVVVRDPVSMSSYSAENHVAVNMVVSNHVRMAAPEGWQFRSKEEGQPKEIVFWIRDKGSNSTQGVVRLNKLDFQPDLERVAPRYAELAMREFRDREVRESEVDGYPAQIVSGRKDDGSIERISALVATGSNNLIEITFAASANRLLANPSLPYSILNSYKLMPGNLSVRHIRDALSFRCSDGHWIWLGDDDRLFLKNAFTVAGVVDGSLVLINVGRISTTQFRDLFKLEIFDVPEHETEVHIAGETFPARSIGHHVDKHRHSGAKYFFKRGDKDYLLGITWVAKKSEPADPNTIQDHPGIREALDKYFAFSG